MTVALIGVNGSGKSTLLKLMTQIIFPNKGTIETHGKLTSLLELGAGFHPDFSGRENIYFNSSIFGLTKKEIDSRLEQIIEFSELGELIDNPVRTYSSGQYMRLAFSVGKTMVFVTHSMESVRNLCDRAIWLYDGKVRMDGNTNEVVNEYLRVTT